MSERHNRVPHNYQSKIGYDSLIRKVILKEFNNIMGTTIKDLDIKIKNENY